MSTSFDSLKETQNELLGVLPVNVNGIRCTERGVNFWHVPALIVTIFVTVNRVLIWLK
jgi:hypothetical protein